MSQFLFAAMFGAAATIGVLHYELTPWRVIKQEQLDRFQAELTAARTIPVKKPGEWMFDPNYRTALEKTKIAGVTESSSMWDSRRAYDAAHGGISNLGDISSQLSTQGQITAQKHLNY